MQKERFAHLHMHTCHSIGDGFIKVKNLMKRAKELEIEALAITDHGTAYGWVEFAIEAKKAGIKYIIGCEMYITPSGRFKSERDSRHVILLVKNDVGYANLCRLVSLATMEGYYYTGRIDYEILERYSEGLICLSACLAGDISRTIQYASNAGEKSKDHTSWNEIGYEAGLEKARCYKKLFGEDFYIELQDNGIEEQYVMNEFLIRIARELDIELVATNDAHYIKKSDAKYHDAYMADGEGKTIADKNRKMYSSQEFYVKSYEEMTVPCHPKSNVPIEAVHNTIKVADKCTYEYNFEHIHMPAAQNIPEGYTNDEYLLKLVLEKAPDHYENFEEVEGNVPYDRLMYEIDVIKNMGYSDYFLMLRDFVEEAERKEIWTGPGRGSAVGCAIAYVLDIVWLDPIEHGLLFERFLNPSRISMPDIDWDIEDERREELIEYVKKNYDTDVTSGEPYPQCIAQIVTFMNMHAKGSVRAVGRVLNWSYDKADNIAKMIPNDAKSIYEAIEMSVELRELYNSTEEYREFFDCAEAFCGMPRSTGKHAAGLVIAPRSLFGLIPLTALKGNMNDLVVAFDMKYLEEAGFLKMDFLGLATLKVIKNTVKHIEKNHGVKITQRFLWTEAWKLPESYELIAKGDTAGLFQVEGGGMTSAAVSMKISNFDETVALISLYRPGPMDYIPTYIRNKNNPELISYEFAELEEILKSTYAVLVYQEQVMQILRSVAGYSMADADHARKAISKKVEADLAKHREWMSTGLKDKDGNTLIPGGASKYPIVALHGYFDGTIVPFAKYCFNKSHAAGYAVVTVATSYLKLFYRPEFMSATIEHAAIKGAMNDVTRYSRDATKAGIKLTFLSVNDSYYHYLPVNNTIRVGFCCIKSLEGSVAKAIEDERLEGGVYTGPSNFITRISFRCGLGRQSMEGLIKSGALDCFGYSRISLLVAMDKISDKVKTAFKKIEKQELRKSEESQSRITTSEAFHEIPTNEKKKRKPKVVKEYTLSELLPTDEAIIPPLKEFSMDVIAAIEFATCGMYMTRNPLDIVKSKMKAYPATHDFSIIEEINSSEDGLSTLISEDYSKGIKYSSGTTFRGICILSEVKETKTRKSGDKMYILTLTDYEGSTSAVVFPRDAAIMMKIEVGEIVQVGGTMNFYEGRTGIIVNDIFPVTREPILTAVIRRPLDFDVGNKIKELALLYPGTNPIVLMPIESYGIKIPPKFWLNKAGMDTIRGFQGVTIFEEE